MLFRSKGLPTRNKIPIADVIPWAILALTWLLAMIFQYKYGELFLNSDLAAEMLLAKEMNDSGSILFAKDWCYSTEIRVFYQHIPFRLGLLLWPNNWHLARVFGQGVMLALHATSFIYMMSALGYRRAGVYGAAVLMCPFGYWYLFHGVFGGQYLSHMILISTSIGLLLRLLKDRENRRRPWILLGVTLVFAFLQGLGGIRMLMNLYAPLSLALVVMFVLRLNKAPLEDKLPHTPHFRALVLAAMVSISCFAGFIINSAILSKQYIFASQNNRFYHHFLATEFLNQLASFLSLFGYPYSYDAQSYSTNGWHQIYLFSKSGMSGAACFVLIAAIIFATVRLAKLWHKLSFNSQLIYATFLACLAVNGIVYSLLESNLNASYWLPIIPLTIACFIIWIKNENFRLQSIYQYGITAILLICTLFSSFSNTLQFIRYPSRAAHGIHAAVDWLQENEYSAGYASFWCSNIVTELSDGQIEMWTTEDVHDLTVRPWLQKRSHLDTPPTGKCFVLVPTASFNNWEEKPFAIYDDTIAYYDENGFTILVYDSPTEIVPESTV